MPANRRALMEEYAEALEALHERKKYNKLSFYEPTEKQREFHDCLVRQRLLMAANQSGKSYSASMEIAYHMTGLYPEWWKGHRFTTPTRGWAAGVTRESTRDNPQRLLLGEGRDWGSGSIPRHLLLGPPSMSSGIPDTADGFQVRHVSGGVSTCHFKSYERGREKFQGETLHWFWGDEEMPQPIYSEALTRLNRHRGLFLMTFTPLLGMTEVVRLFVEPQEEDLGRDDRAVIHMDISEATFYTEKQINDIIAQYPEHERRARTQGLPLLGEGLVYPVPDDVLSIPAFPIPDHFRKIAAVDFGGASPTGHFFAGAFIAYDPDTDIIYLYDTLKQRGTTVAENGSALLKRGCKDLPVAWPHDGEQADPGSGKPLAALYQDEGVYMLALSARYDDKTGGRQAKEPIIADLLIRMRTGRFKVFSHLLDFFKEKAMFHRKDGKVVAEFDDLISAVHYACMMLRYSVSVAEMRGMVGGVEQQKGLSYLSDQTSWI